MKKTTLLNALLSLAVAIEFVYGMGERFGTWYRNGGRQTIISAVAYVIAAVLWTAETVTMGAKVLYRNRVAIMEAAGKPFIYA